jgi:MarR family transcriptional regulator, organic hydroperoxide resistance regulator
MKTKDIDAIVMDLAELLPLFQQKLIKPFEQLAKTNISPLLFYVMFALEEKGDLPMTQLSNALRTSKQQMTPMVDKLIKHGFVERKHGEDDRRLVKISLSPAGKQFLGKQKAEIFEMLKNKIKILSDDDLETLRKSFNEIRQIISKLS